MAAPLAPIPEPFCLLDAVRCWDEIVDSLEQGYGKLRTRIHLIYTIGK